MKFFLDHDVPAEVGRVLRQVGHEVIELRQVLPPHASDFEALEYAREHGLFLITCTGTICWLWPRIIPIQASLSLFVAAADMPNADTC